MYNEQLENLIDAALADGVLTEKEKQILFKKAQAMDIDLDEFEMVLDARLVELKKKEARENEQYQLEMEKAKAAQKSAPKSSKYGDVRKCPACGAMVESFTTKCPECGYEFANTEANSMAQKLLDKLEAVDALEQQKGSPQSGLDLVSSILKPCARAFGFGKNAANERKVQIIRTFPIPNTKEDLIEMLTLAHANSKGFRQSSIDEEDLKRAWKAKEKQAMAKADIVLKDDADYLALKKSWKKKWGLF